MPTADPYRVDPRAEVAAEIVKWLRDATNGTAPMTGPLMTLTLNDALRMAAPLIADEIEKKWGG